MTFPGFYVCVKPECDDRVRVVGWLSKSDKKLGVGGWRVISLFEAADSGDVLAHLCITSTKIFYSSKSTITLVTFHLSSSKSL